VGPYISGNRTGLPAFGGAVGDQGSGFKVSELYVAVDQQYINENLSFRMSMIMPDAPAFPFVVSSSICRLMSRAGEIKATMNPEPLNLLKHANILYGNGK